MEDNKETTKSIIDQLEEYIETRITLAKYKAVEQGSSFIASLIIILIFAFIATFALVFASVTLSLYLADVLASNWKGFGIVAAIYLVLAFIMMAAKTSIEKPIINGFIKKIFK